MERANYSKDTFSDCVQHANNVASRILRVDFGGFTSEDVVGAFIEKQVRRGEGQTRIEEMMKGPKLSRYLKNTKNDLWRNEVALKRGNGVPHTSLEEIEHYYGSNRDNPETLLIEKEDAIEKKDLLAAFIRDAGLSRTEIQILGFDAQGHSSETIAGLLKTDVDTVYSRRSEALRKLKKQVKRTAKR
jgi:DNA-binding CsgD family transcriptional regulator